MEGTVQVLGMLIVRRASKNNITRDLHEQAYTIKAYHYCQALPEG